MGNNKIYLVGNLEDIDRAIYGNPCGMDIETLNGLLPAFAKDIRDVATVLNTIFDGVNANHHACRLRDVARLLEVLGYRTEDECAELKEELHKYKSGHGHYTAQCKKLEEENELLRKEIQSLQDDIEKALKERHMFKRIADIEQANAIKAEEQTETLKCKLAAIEDIIKEES